MKKMLINSIAYQPQNAQLQNKNIGFGNKMPSIQELEAQVKHYTEMIKQYPNNRSLPAYLKNAQKKLEEALKSNHGKQT